MEVSIPAAASGWCQVGGCVAHVMAPNVRFCLLHGTGATSRRYVVNTSQLALLC